MVHFVGAGPGAVDLITVRGKKLLEEADVVIYAGSLVNPQLLEYTKPDCAIYDSAYMTLEEVLTVIRNAEANGLTTVRLHTGDTALYSTIREQIDEMDAEQIKIDVCPGVSAFSGAAAVLEEEFTLPGVTQSIILTRTEGRTPMPEGEDLHSWAKHQATLCLYLSSGQPEKVEAELIEGGYPPETPVAIVYKATWPEQRILRHTLRGFAEAMKAAGITKTALIIVSGALGGQNNYERSKLYSADFSTEFRAATE